MFRKVHVLDICDILNDPSKQDPDQLRFHNPEDFLSLEDNPRNVGVFLTGDGDSWSHAGVTECLRIREVLLAILIDVVGLSAHRGHTLPAWFFMRALIVQVLEVV